MDIVVHFKGSSCTLSTFASGLCEVGFSEVGSDYSMSCTPRDAERKGARFVARDVNEVGRAACTRRAVGNGCI